MEPGGSDVGPDEPDVDPDTGAGVVNLAFAGTGALVGTSLAAAIWPDRFGQVHAGLSLVLFAIGVGALLWAYALGVARSRTHQIALAELFFLAGGVAPRLVRHRLRVALAVQVVVVVAAASIRPYTDVAFGVLAPMHGLGLLGYWGGRHGRFPPRSSS